MSDAPIRTSIAPWIAVGDGATAVEHYAGILGAVDAYRLEGEDGKVLVARLEIDGAAFWISEDPGHSPKARGPGPVRMILVVDDPDARFERAVAAGATAVAPVEEAHGWRTGRITDAFGYDWEFSRPVAP
jgi:PhnB protein